MRFGMFLSTAALIVTMGLSGCYTVKNDSSDENANAKEAEEKYGISMKYIAEKNTAEELVSAYGRVEADFTDSAGNSVMYIYMDSVIKYCEMRGYQELITNDTAYDCPMGEYDSMHEDKNTSRTYFTNPVMDPANELEKLKTVDERESDYIMETEYTAADSETAMTDLGLAYSDGDILTYKYTLDKETMAVLERETLVKHNDGTAQITNRYTLTPKTERPQNAVEMYQKISGLLQ